MSEARRTWQLVRGDELLAELVVTGGDFPWLNAEVRPAAGFADVRRLFDDERTILCGSSGPADSPPRPCCAASSRPVRSGRGVAAGQASRGEGEPAQRLEVSGQAGGTLVDVLGAGCQQVPCLVQVLTESVFAGWARGRGQLSVPSGA